ncbi:MAG: hypothetical protein ACOX7U_00250 [Desulfitobacteriia bacterium]|jgi:hypothetical protein
MGDCRSKYIDDALCHTRSLYRADCTVVLAFGGELPAKASNWGSRRSHKT